MTDAKEPEVIRTLRQEVRDGNVFLHDKHNEVVCATAVILNAWDTLTRERDEARRAVALWWTHGDDDVLLNAVLPHMSGQEIDTLGRHEAPIFSNPHRGPAS